MDECGAVVIGAGVVGLATARALAMAGHEVVIVDAAAAIGSETSSRNSEVIHAGLYYPTGSLKAELCVRGRHDLYRYCEARGIPHRRCGKLIVASDSSEEAYLARLEAQALANGVDDVRQVGRQALRELEPALVGTAALLSPSTGIIDSHALMLAYLGDAEAAGAVLALRTPVERGECTAGGIVLSLGGAEPTRLRARIVVNAAGLGAWTVSRGLEGMAPSAIPPCHLCKGNYFSVKGRSPTSHLVYPIPNSAGLGVHLTMDLAGHVRFGPDVEWIETIDYAVDAGRCEGFYAAIRRYWPALPEGSLEPDYAGIRPKLAGPGQPAADFAIHGPDETGVPGYAALYGIESPGLTAATAIAERVCTLLGAKPL